MKTDVRLSTRFLTAQNAHQVGLLVNLEGETPVRRAPINVALVLDRSGSMSGAPLEAAKTAAARFVSFLAPQDRLSVVVFDDDVHTIFGPAAGGADAAAEAIGRVQAGGSTNLSGGWLKGRTLVEQGRVEGTNRVLLLTDGQANQGIVEPTRLIGLAHHASKARVSTTCIGFGRDFNEDLLESMARAGAGNYWYVESDDQMAGIFDGEIEGLVALAAQNVEVEVRLSHPGVAGVSFLQSYPVTHTEAGGWKVQLHDLYATSPRALGLVFHVEDVGVLGKVQLGEVRVEADLVTEEGIEHRTTVMPVFANLDGEDRVEPTVEQTFLRFRAAKAREEAVRQADQGDFDSASACLREAAAALANWDGPDTREEIDDLQAEAAKMDQRRYDATDRKYQAARAMAARDLKAEYAKRVSRRAPRKS
ncbi:MAG TPA: VWA domain-containing protein [Gemmatimonadales bacterium]|nr:VWA domain-containing protein [Gemmatimonadales bacterium]